MAEPDYKSMFFELLTRHNQIMEVLRSHGLFMVSTCESNRWSHKPAIEESSIKEPEKKQ